MKITRIWFDKDYIYGLDEGGKKYRQSLLWYTALKNATEEERSNYKTPSHKILRDPGSLGWSDFWHAGEGA